MKTTLMVGRVAMGVTLAALMLTTRSSRAQDGAGTAPPSSPAAVPAPAPPPAPPPPPAAPSPPAPAAEDTTVSDHEQFVGHLGVTYFDITNLPIANPVADPGTGSAATPAPGSITGTNIAAPVVGVRYWLQRNIGIDAGIGFGLAGGSQEAVVGSTDTTVDKVSSTGFAFHGGVPIAFAHFKHYTFLAIPEFTLGFTSATFKPVAATGGTAGPQQDLSGFLFDLGARIGAEIHFGFIGIPQLALQATIGLSYRRSVYKWKSDSNSASDGTNTFGTNVQADPWAIFKDAISATYYF
ncbi:MAG TPA: hypothetical protein VIF15_18340 [Polyangiaceae bacterium]|jgi:hypothetical protein